MMRFIRADKVFNGSDFFPVGTVLILDGQQLTGILDGNEIDPLKIEEHHGIITPGFVNAHCHLELSHLAGQISQKKGLSAFAMELMGKRNLADKEAMLEAMRRADQEMERSGIVAVGDISNSDLSFQIKANSRLSYHTFVELIGLNPAVSAQAFNSGVQLYEQLRTMKLRASLAPHAPYSTSRELVKAIAEFDKSAGKPFSIHFQESEEELEFMQTARGAIAGLYEFLKIDISWHRAPGGRSLAHLGPIRELPAPSILVHNTAVNSSDLDVPENSHLYWCFCPSANLYIEDRLPDFDLFSSLHLCVGTDSLASNDGLDLIKELNLIRMNSSLDTVQLLAAATSGGAGALGLQDEFGSLNLNTSPGLNLIGEKEGKFTFMKKLC